MDEIFVETKSKGEVNPKKGANPRQLQEHQQDAISALDNLNKNFSSYSTLIVLPTGGGKTYTASNWLLKNAIDKNKKILWLAHRQLLLEQAAESFQKFAYSTDIQHISSFNYKIISGATSHERTCNIEPSDNLLIISKDSLGRNLNRLDAWLDNEDEIFLVIDEAHHSTAKTYRKVIDYVKLRVKNLKLIGLTATPFRTAESEQGLLAKIFTDGTRDGKSVKNDVGIVYQIGLKDLINRRILSAPKFETYYTDEKYGEELGLKALESIQQLDKLPDDIAKEIAESSARNKLIVQTYKKKADEYGQTIVFTVSINHAIALTKLFNNAGISAEYVVSSIKDAGTGVTLSREDNERKIELYRSGKIKVLVNVNILTEGVDLPMTKTVFLTRPTVSTILMTQMVGRALRGPAANGTEIAYIVSFIDNWNEKISWVNPDTIFTGANDFDDKDTEYQQRMIRLISIAKIEEFASILSNSIDTTALEAVPFAQRIPIGMYAFQYLNEEGVDFSYQVMVYDSTKNSYEKFMQALPSLFENLNSDEEYLPEEILNKLVKTCEEKFFSGEMIPPYDERDILHILKYFAQKSECPNFYTFEHIDKSKLDVEKIAQEIVNKDMRRSEKNNYLDELWDNGDENILRLFFGKKIYFSRIVESELFKLENPEYYQQNQKNVTYGKKKLEELPLSEIAKINPELEKSLREGAFKKAKVGNEYQCAVCGRKFFTRQFLQVDHIKSLNNGGLSVPENLQILCRSCNAKKGDKENFNDFDSQRGGGDIYIDDTAGKDLKTAMIEKIIKSVAKTPDDEQKIKSWLLNDDADFQALAESMNSKEIKNLKKIRKDIAKFDDALTDSDTGKIFIYDHYCAVPGWEGSMYYLISKDFKKIRLFDITAQIMLEANEAVRINDDEFENMTKKYE